LISSIDQRKMLLGMAVMAGLALAAFAYSGQETSPGRENRILKQELELARSPALYFILDFRAEKIELKSRGMTLREWKIEKIRRWGKLPSPGAVTLDRKSTLFPPKRAKIKPGAEEEGSFELDALELKDMPSSFAFFLEGGIRIYVRPSPRGFFAKIAGAGGFLVWNLWIPLKNLVFEIRKKPFGAFDFVLRDREEAQSLYWAFPQGIKGIIVSD